MRTSLRRIPVLLSLLLLAAPVLARAQGTDTLPSDSAKVAVIRELLAQSHAVDRALSVMEQSIPAQRAANPRIPAVFWDRFMEVAQARRAELQDMMIVVYDRHFSTDELRQLLAFYQTPIGQKMLQVQPVLLRESMQAGQQWGQRIGAEVGEELAKEGIRLDS